MEQAKRAATLTDLLAIDPETRFHELIGGELVRKAAPSAEHGDAQAGVVTPIRSRYHGPPRDGGGGWWIMTEVEVRLSTGDVVRPDIVGWRRTTCPERPTGTPVEVRPDWICEVVSPSNASHDTVRKVRLYQAAAIPYDWLCDPQAGTLTVLRWSAEGYVTALVAEPGETVEPKPFGELQLAVGRLFGDDA